MKTCGVPVIDTSEMGNRSVRLGDKVIFNCKVICTLQHSTSCIFSTFVSTSWFRPTSVWSLEFGNPISPLKIKALILILTVRIFYQRTQDGISLYSRFSTLEQFKLCRAFQSQESEHCSIPCSIAECFSTIHFKHTVSKLSLTSIPMNVDISLIYI